jgi:hypothetical protein
MWRGNPAEALIVIDALRSVERCGRGRLRVGANRRSLD